MAALSRRRFLAGAVASAVCLPQAVAKGLAFPLPAVAQERSLILFAVNGAEVARLDAFGSLAIGRSEVV